jgi:molecular chaperone GrpE
MPNETKKNTQSSNSLACPICGFHYRDEDTAKKCEAWCKEHGSCSAEITKLSVEREAGSKGGSDPARGLTPEAEGCDEGVCKMPPRSASKGSDPGGSDPKVPELDFEAAWKRALADYQNLQKEVARERMEMGAYAVLRVVERFLPVVDNFNVAMSHMPKTDDKAVLNWSVGVGFIQKQLDEAMKDLGLTPIKTVGEKFDATKHEAVGEEEVGSDPERGLTPAPGTILKEVQAGYEVLGKVVRPAKVIVAK